MPADPAGARFRRAAFIVDSLQVAGAHGGPFQYDDAAALEDAVQDGLGQVVVMQRGAPVLERLVGGEQQRTPLQAAGVDDVEQDIGGVGAAAERAELVHDQHGGPDIGLEGFGEAALAAGAGEIVDERGRAGEEGVEAVLDGLVGDGCGQMGRRGRYGR